MKRATLIWTVLFVAGGGFLVIRATTSEKGMGLAYVHEVPVEFDDAPGWTMYQEVYPKDRDEPDVRFSWSRTIGLWVAALLSLCIFSFLYGDNPFYKLAESVFVGVSAAYAMVIGFWAGIVDKLCGRLIPSLMRDWALPGIPTEQEPEWIYVVPLTMGIMLLWRLLPVGGWVSRWPLAFFIGATAGIRLLTFLEADFVAQIRSTILPLVVMAADGTFDPASTIKNITVVIGVASCLCYFFFSIEHRGAFGAVSRLGIWFLMIGFGAAFAFTVMGRIALLIERLQFLFDDWLWLIDPLSHRTGI